MTDAPIPSQPDAAASEAKQPQAVCLRCRTPGPVNDDGFCGRCEKALEQACL